MATPDDLAETAKEVEALDRRVVARQADVRDEAGLRAAFEAGVAELGPVDIVVANAGIAPMSLGEEPHEAWQDAIDVNLTGVFNTVEIAVPSMIERGAGGAIVLTSSTAGLNGIGGGGRGGLGYTASKHGVVGLTRQMAVTYSARGITINAVAPGPILTGLRAHSQEILGPGVPDMSGRGVAVSDEQVRAIAPAGRRGTVEEIASAVCYLAHALRAMRAGSMRRALFMAKGSLFLGRMTESADGVSFLLEA